MIKKGIFASYFFPCFFFFSYLFKRFLNSVFISDVNLRCVRMRRMKKMRTRLRSYRFRVCDYLSGGANLVGVQAENRRDETQREDSKRPHGEENRSDRSSGCSGLRRKKIKTFQMCWRNLCLFSFRLHCEHMSKQDGLYNRPDIRVVIRSNYYL